MTPLMGQSFDSRSDGSDGALDLSSVTPGTTVLFDPATFSPPLDPDGDNVFHFTTITVPTNVTVRLSAPDLNWSPVYWLATGAVRIDGRLNLNGESGHPANALPEQRQPSIPGPGGFPGGIGGDNISSGTVGYGPGAGVYSGGGASHAGSFGNSTYGNVYLLPLAGGSGGAGSAPGQNQVGPGGGAGGGAILIASSVSITVDGQITANGGPSGASNSSATGSGGAIRLLAPVIEGSGSLATVGRLNTSLRIGHGPEAVGQADSSRNWWCVPG